MTDWTDEALFRELSQIVVKFPLLQCDNCARDVMLWLRKNGIEGKVLRLRTKNRKDRYILSYRIGDNQSITDNGQHYGVEVRGMVFDNLSAYGLSREAWINDFSCRSGQFIIEELEEV